MDKPLILLERETRERVVEIVNNSQLPAFVLKSIFKDILEQLVSIEQEQYNITLQEYQNKGDEENESNN